MYRRARTVGSVLCLVLLAGFTAACDVADDPTGMNSSPLFAVGDYNSDNSGDVIPGVVNLCSFRVYPDTYGPASFSASAPDGEDVLEGIFELNVVPTCVEIWNATPSNLASVDVTGTLESTPAGLQISTVFTKTTGNDGVFTNGATSGTVNVSNDVGGLIWFKFDLADDPGNGGGAGCTPGFWRQPHHYQYWTDFTPDQTWGSVFADPGSNRVPGGGTFTASTTLGEAVELGGGGILALARHGVAALLNASSSEVSYDLSVADVTALVNGAIASGSYNAAKDLLEAFNEQGCTVDKSN
jgi:hypothetical protein